MKKLLLLLLTSSFIFANEQKITEEVYDDSKQAVSIVYNDVKSLTPKIENGIKSIAEGLKVGAESVWNILVKQQKVWSIAFLILTLSSIINWFLFYKRYLYKKSNNKIEYTVLERDLIGDIINPKYEKYYADRYENNPNEYKNDIRRLLYIKGPIGKEQYNAPKITNIENETTFNKFFKYIHLTICIVLSVFSIRYFGSMLTGFINPEYGAMSDILFVALKLK